MTRWTRKTRDENYESKESRRQGGKRKIDVMGPISLTADARNLSLRDQVVMAASVANAIGVNIDDTNISKSTAWYQRSKQRVKRAKEVMDEFVCSDKVVVHWDGKTLTLKGKVESKRVCVYLSGVEAEKSIKLLGIPECSSGKGVDEFQVVREYLVKWKVKEQIIGMVFDTTNSNSGEHSGACKYLEVWVDSPLLWLACRHHIAELHMGTATKEICGETKEPGVSLFRRLRDTWYSLEPDMEDLPLLDLTSLTPGLQEEAKSVLEWAQSELLKRTGGTSPPSSSPWPSPTRVWRRRARRRWPQCCTAWPGRRSGLASPPSLCWSTAPRLPGRTCPPWCPPPPGWCSTCSS